MIEAAIIMIIASGLWVVANQFTKRNPPSLPIGQDDERQSLSLIAEGGLYKIAAPTLHYPPMRAFHQLQLIEGGIRLRDNLTKQRHIADFAAIEWVSAVTFPQTDIAEISIHLESEHRWHTLTLQMPQSDMAILVKVISQVVNAARVNLGRPPAKPIGPLAAHIAEDTLQGVSQLGAEVSLYLLPHMLIVLQGDVIKAKLDTSSIRRVLSVERMNGRLDSLMKRKTQDGVIRLYSLHETVAFALPQFRELAEEIAYLSRCPVEFITQEDKSGKI